MGIGGGSGGGGFKLEKTWRATGVGSTTFNTPSSFNIPFGKYEILVAGRAGSGNPNSPGNLASYNPLVPSTISGYNPIVPSNISAYNTFTPGNPTGVFNAGSGGNLAGYTQSGGNIANYNSATSGGFNVSSFVQQYLAAAPGFPGNPTGSYNPSSGGNLAGYNIFAAGSANYNAVITGTANYNTPTPGGTATINTTYVCEPAGPFFDPANSTVRPALFVDEFRYNSFYTEYDIYTIPNAQFSCPTPSTNYQIIPSSPGNISNYNSPSGGNINNYNPPSGGNPNYNSGTPGTQIYNPPRAPFPAEYNTLGPYAPEFSSTCPAFESYYQAFYQIYNDQITTFYETINHSCTPVPGSPGNANYNATTNTPVFNPFVEGSQNFNAPTGGNPNYNASSGGNAVFNAAGGQNANYNTPSGGTPGAPSNVLGVYFPGGNAGADAPFVGLTRINRYIADDTTYPVDVPPGGFIIVQNK